MISVSYDIFFKISLLHEYFASGRCDDVRFAPSADCQVLFNQLKVQWRVIEGQLIALTRVNGVDQPYVISPGLSFQDGYGQQVFRIYLQVKGATFFNYSNLPADLTQNIFYFSNLADNAIDPTHTYLSKRLPDILGGKAYQPGDFAMKPASNTVFEALTPTASAAVGDLGTASLWAPKGTLQFPGPGDQLELVSGPYLFVLPAAVTAATVQVFGFNFNAAAPAFDAAVLAPQTLAFDTATPNVPVSLEGLKPGRYGIQVTAGGTVTTKLVYYDPQWQQSGAFGIIELFNHLPQTDAYSILKPTDTLQGKVFQLQFPTRRVLWKYVRTDATAQAISDTGATGYPFALNADSFVSGVPIPLADTGQTQLNLTFSNGNNPLAPLTNPSPIRLVKYKQAGYDYPCCEMYLNY